MKRIEIAGGLAILAAVGLAALLAAPWYSGAALLPGTGTADLGEINAWEAFEWEDGVILAAAAVVAVAMYLEFPGISLAAGVAAVGLIVYRLIDQPFEEAVMGGGREVDPAWGLWASLGAAAVMALAALSIVIEDRRAP
jgi:hypothetical protein